MIEKERLSSIVDNEHIDAALLDELGQDEALSSSWQHYHLIGDVMRGETPTAVNLDLTRAISAAIAEEPALIMPKESANDSSFYQKVIQPWLKTGGQFAIAASVTLMVITGVQYSNTEAPITGLEPALNVMPFAGIASPVSLSIESPDSRQVQPEFTDEEKVEQVRRINAFVLDHQLQKRIQQ
ncbi:sigma-E factor negative regulatory protein [Moritella sp. Urea-trap-13]|uniref:sigma-E factor negative regulatory protein n=1 Tax=Moritella sp. Urea-trap-13 TaxID=2058327 RepID=UPI000C32C690|nr:RseA family anti-sigma factor [Moritella sp. Urea-trap-13]PKH05452.1 Negative regulator of sigma E activity [Moritella sp. Urea-trap-13]